VAAVAITHFRQIVHGFYPAVLADHGLASSLDNLVSELPWTATCRATALPRFDQRVEMGIYFCLAAIVGSLRDMHRDADSERPARGLDLEVLLDNDTLPPTLSTTVVVHADGPVSFDADTIDPDTIDAIDDRVGALDGRLGIAGEPSGLRLTLSVPIPTADPAAGPTDRTRQ
jgi:signal transduction histidine kinase